MKKFNWESKEEKQLTSIINEELDRKNNSNRNLDTEIYQPEVVEEEERINKNDPEKQFIPIEDIPDDFNLEEYILNIIDRQYSTENEEINEVKAPATTHLPIEIKKIIQKYSLPNDEWKKLTYQQRKTRLESIQTEIAEIYIKKPKKMVPKKKK